MVKLLWVEANDDNRDMQSGRLIRQGFDVVLAATTSAAPQRPDVNLMDVALSAMSGWDATLANKTNAQTAALPIIAVTVHAHATDRVRSMEVDCRDFDATLADPPRLPGKISAALALNPSASSKMEETST